MARDSFIKERQLCISIDLKELSFPRREHIVYECYNITFPNKINTSQNATLNYKYIQVQLLLPIMYVCVCITYYSLYIRVNITWMQQYLYQHCVLEHAYMYSITN